MDKEIPYSEVEEWLQLYSRWKVRITMIKAQLPCLFKFAEQLERVKLDNEAEPDLLRFLKQMVKDLERNQTHLQLYELRLFLLEVCLDALTAEEQDFVRLKYFERRTNEDVMERMMISHSTFFRWRRDIAEKVYRSLGESKGFLRVRLPEGNGSYYTRFFSDNWFMDKKLDSRAFRPMLPSQKTKRSVHPISKTKWFSQMKETMLD